MDSKTELAQVVEYLYRSHGFLKKDIAERVGINQQQLSNALRTKNFATSKKTLDAIRAAYERELGAFAPVEHEQERVSEKLDYVTLLEQQNEEYRNEIDRLRKQVDKLLDALLGGNLTDVSK